MGFRVYGKNKFFSADWVKDHGKSKFDEEVEDDEESE